MLWPAARVARALWRGVEETAGRWREPCGCSRCGVPSALRRALLNRLAFLPEGSTKFVCISYKQELQGVVRRNKRKAARGGYLVFAKQQENTGERLAAGQIDAFPLLHSRFVGTERPFARYVDFAGSEFRLSGENLMKTITLLFGACAVVAFPLGTAAAGPCTTEIENVTKLLASRDAGSGPTAGAAGTTTGQHPPTSAMGAADSSTAASAAAAESAKPQHPPTAVMNQATQGGGASPRAGETAREQHPPTAAMNEATQGGAASPQDVQSQTRGGPTAAQQAEGARRPASDRLASAQSALEQARRFDASGQEAQCMEAIGRARGLVH